MKLGQLIEHEKHFSEKIVYHISGSVVESFMQFVFTLRQVVGYRNWFQTICFHLI